MSEVSGIGLTAAAVGAIFVYGGLKGKSPLAAIQSVIRGQDPRTNAQTSPIDVSSNVTSGSYPGADTPVSSSGSANEAIAKRLVPSYGWSDSANWSALVSLWNKESGWNNTADTRKTGAGGDNASSSVFAYGIAQARPASKYPKAGQPPDLGGKADPQTQIVWGLDYIRSRYGSPRMAWAHELANNWY